VFSPRDKAGARRIRTGASQFSSGRNPAYQLFLEADGDDADRPIGDTEGVDLTKGPKHYYAVPPATFGKK
jgi:hypothetical protein